MQISKKKNITRNIEFSAQYIINPNCFERLVITFLLARGNIRIAVNKFNGGA
jgi:hypothetical protein